MTPRSMASRSVIRIIFPRARWMRRVPGPRPRPRRQRSEDPRRCKAARAGGRGTRAPDVGRKGLDAMGWFAIALGVPGGSVIGVSARRILRALPRYFRGALLSRVGRERPVRAA